MQRGGDLIAAKAARTRSLWAEMAPDLLTNIFLRLPLKQRLLHIPSVCKPWRLASQDPLCWQKFNLLQVGHRHHETTCDDEFIPRLLQRCQGCLKELTLPCIPQLDRSSLYLLACSVPLLEKLDIGYSLADDEWATYAAPLMPHLTDLNLIYSTGKLSHLAIEAFGRSCKGITRFTWRQSFDNHKICTINDSEALAIAQHYPLLQHLILESHSLSSQGLRAILENCPALEYFVVVGCSNLINMDATLLNLCRPGLEFVVRYHACYLHDDDDDDNYSYSSYDSYDDFLYGCDYDYDYDYDDEVPSSSLGTSRR